MLNVKVEYIEDKSMIILNMDGHAGQNDVGKDIVCSAATILAYTIAQNINDMYAEKKLRKKPNISLKEGKASIVCVPKKDHLNEALNAFYVIEKGFVLLAHNYPQYVHITCLIG